MLKIVVQIFRCWIFVALQLIPFHPILTLHLLHCVPICDAYFITFSFFAAKHNLHNIFDNELYQKSGQTIDWLHYIEEKAKGLLNVNDYTALMKQIKDVSFFLT